MAGTSWQHRIARAEELAVEHSFAAELLSFYVRLCRFQEGLHSRLAHFPADGFSGPLESDQLLNGSEAFLLMVEEHGPALLADVARRLRSSQMQNEWPALLNITWLEAGRIPQEPQDFLARAFLQPLAERIRSRLPARGNGTSSCLCPFCGRKPGTGILRPQGDGALRSLSCSFCCGEWEFRRIVCPNCGEEDNKKLPVYTASDFPYIRVECCDSCKTYIKSVDLTKTGHADPVVDEIASAPLDLWASERAYAKVHPNLLGL
ncbi:MAG: formate dehydrogenase accessory protein FdhE [Candidatus Sulfotelmatobacter sp.]